MVRVAVGDTLNELAASAARVIPEGIIDRRKRQVANTLSPSTWSNVGDTVRALNTQLATTMDVITRFAADFLARVTTNAR